MKKSATFSPDKVYRYRLDRVWDTALPMVGFLCLNPSIADEYVDDPTIRKCIKYARGWGYGGLSIGNLFAYRVTNPEILASVASPIGPKNDWYLREIRNDVEILVAAWSNYGHLMDRFRAISNIVGELHALRINKSGHPAHPLYLPSSLKPFPWSPS